MSAPVSRKAVVNSGMWSLVESGGLSLLSFGTLVALSRFLSPDDFGLFAVSLGLIEMLALVSNVTFHDVLIQREKTSEEDFNTAFTLSLLFALTLCLLCWAGGNLYSNLIHDPRGGKVLLTMSCGMLFSGPVSPVTAMQKRQFGFRVLALRSLVGRLIGAALGIGAAVAGMGVWSLVLQYVAMQFFSAAVLFAFSKLRLRLSINIEVARELLAFGIPSVASQFASFASKRLLMLLSAMALGTAETGYLNLAMRTIDTFWAVASTSFGQVALALLASLRREPQRQDEAYLQGLSIATALFAPAFVGMAATAHDTINVLYGARWLPAQMLLSAIAMILLMAPMRMLMPPLLAVRGRPKTLLRINASMLAVMTLGAAGVVLLRANSAGWVVAVMGLSEATLFVLAVCEVARVDGIALQTQWAAVWRPLIASAGMGVSVLLISVAIPAHIAPALRLGGEVLFGFMSYVLLIFLMDRSTFLKLISSISNGNSIYPRSL